MSQPFFRLMRKEELDLLLDQLFLSTGLRPQPHTGGLLLLSGGQPILRTIDSDPHPVVFFYPPFFKEPQP